MKLKHTRARKANRLNYWPAYQKWFYGADCGTYSLKHRELDNAVEGYKSRLALQSNGVHAQAR